MASTIDSVENPEYPFDHLISIKLMDIGGLRSSLPALTWVGSKPSLAPFFVVGCVSDCRVVYGNSILATLQ